MTGLKVDYSGLTELVAEEKRSHGGRGPRRSGFVRRGVRRVAIGGIAALLFATFPFVVLLQVGVRAHLSGVGPWSALGLASGAVAALLLFYAVVAGRWLGAGPGPRALLRRVAVAAVLGFVGYGLMFVGGSHTKDAAVRAEYRELHPVLRLAASTVFLVDPGRVMTDASRTPEDYWLMGLPVREASLHFTQEETGYAHALDLRTRGRTEWSNRLVEAAFWTMGFHSLRHVGTADHLHVSLRLPE